VEDIASEINEIATAAIGIQQHLRIASEMVKEQPHIAEQNILLATGICRRILTRLEQLEESI